MSSGILGPANLCLAKDDKDIMEDVGEGGGGGGSGPSLWDELEEVAEDAIDWISDAASAAAGAIADGVDWLIEEIIGDVRDLIDKVENLVQIIKNGIDAIVKEGRDLVKSGKQAVNSTFDDIKRTANLSKTQADQIVQNFSANKPEEMSSEEQTVWMSYAKALQFSATKVRDLHIAVTEQAANTIQNHLTSATSQMYAGLTPAISVATGALVTPLDDTLGILGSFLSNPEALINPLEAAEATIDVVSIIVGSILDNLAVAVNAAKDTAIASLELTFEPIRLAQRDSLWAMTIVDRMTDFAADQNTATKSALDAARNNPPPAGSAESDTVAALQNTIDNLNNSEITNSGVEEGEAANIFQDVLDGTRTVLRKADSPMALGPVHHRNAENRIDNLYQKASGMQIDSARMDVIERVNQRYANYGWLNVRAEKLARDLLQQGEERVRLASPARMKEAAPSSIEHATASVSPPKLERGVPSRYGESNAPDATPGASAKASDMQMTNPAVSPSQGETSFSRAATMSPASRRALPAITGITPVRTPLVRGGSAHTVTVTGTNLDKVTVQVMKGRRVVSDVTANVRRISPTSFKVTLKAPSSFKATGDDYYLRILSGKRVIKQTKFTVKTSKIQTPSRPIMRPKPTPGVIQR